MMMKIALLVACVAVAVYGQEKQAMVGGMQMCGTTYCQAGQMCSYQSGYPRCTMMGMNNGMYPGMYPGMNPGMNNGMYPGMNPGMNNGMYPGMNPGMNTGMYPGMGVGMGMAMTEEDKPATAPRVGDVSEEEEEAVTADIISPL